MRRLNHYRNKDFAVRIAKTTGGAFIDQEYTDEFGSYWIVLWN